MKKLLFFCAILTVLCFSGCETDHEVTVTTEPTTCQHNNLGGDGVRYEYGECCEDPMDVYVKCADCGEYVFSASIPSDKKCYPTNGMMLVVREPSCVEEGMGTWECSYCHTEYEESIAKTEHEMMWFFGDDGYSCAYCSYAPDTCAHEYEQIGEQGYGKDFAGSTTFKCKHCGETKVKYFDQYGEFDLQKVADALRDLATRHGFQVVLGYAPTPHGTMIREQESLVYRNTNSKEAAQRLQTMGEKVFDFIMQTHFPPNHDPSEYYLWVDVTYSDGSIASGFQVRFTLQRIDMDE